MSQVRIFQPAKTAMQSGKGNAKAWVLEFAPGAPKVLDPLMGWTGSADTNGQVRIAFESRDAAIAFATRNGLAYSVAEPHARALKLRAYADNFAYHRIR
ncbi:MAG: ETC complex I subunit [Alphaproteobacteria bacterium]|nr:ETC complex I subunit [Alphaproteobacteria bacterium]